MTPPLSVQHLGKSFDGFQANSDITFDVTQGELLAIIGPNGAGKTTLINQLSGELMPDTGSVSIHGRNMTRARPSARSKAGLARSYQVTSLFDDLTALENVALAVHAHAGSLRHLWYAWRKRTFISEEAGRLLTDVGLGDIAQTQVADLSHGEHRQIELAMSLGTDPEILLLDEPMAGLAHAESRAMTDQLQALKGRYTIILVEHDMDAVFALADRIIVLAEGRIIAEGSAQDIRDNPTVQAVYLGREDDHA